jgi:hypothetical protein
MDESQLFLQEPEFQHPLGSPRLHYVTAFATPHYLTRSYLRIFALHLVKQSSDNPTILVTCAEPQLSAVGPME